MADDDKSRAKVHDELVQSVQEDDDVPSTVEFKGKDLKICRNCTVDDGGRSEDGEREKIYRSVHLSPALSSVSPLDHPYEHINTEPHPLLEHIRYSTASPRSVESTTHRREDPPADMTPTDIAIYHEAVETSSIDKEEHRLREMIAQLEAEAAALASFADKAITKAKRALLDVFVCSPSDDIVSSKVRGVMETIGAAEREAACNNEKIVDRDANPHLASEKKSSKLAIARVSSLNDPSQLSTAVGKSTIELNPVDVLPMDCEGTHAGSDEGREPKDLTRSTCTEVSQATKRLLSPKTIRDDVKEIEQENKSSHDCRMDSVVSDGKSISEFKKTEVEDQIRSAVKPYVNGRRRKTASSFIAPSLTTTICQRIEQCQTKLSDPNASILEIMTAAALIEKLAKAVVALDPIEREKQRRS